MKKKLFAAIQHFFDFSANERRGVIILLILIFAIALYRVSSSFFLEKQTHIQSSEVEQKINAFYARQQHIQDSLQTVYQKRQEKKKFNFYDVTHSVAEINLNPFFFDPNQLPEEEWKALGLSDRQIKTIKNYEAKGGKFYKKEDLKKMYCISDAEYKILEPYIRISTSKTADNFSQKETPTAVAKKEKTLSLQAIDLNVADSLELQKVPGIGAKTASRIIAYRQRLGGFVSLNQLKEIYTIDSNRFTQITPYLKIENQSIKKININKAEIKEMLRHPYFDQYLAKSIVVHRQNKGNFQSLEELKTELRLYDELYQKIKPYLSIE